MCCGPDRRPEATAPAEVQKSLARGRIPIITAQKGQTLDLGDGARLEVLAAGLRGAVLLVEWERFRLLLPVGLDFESMQALMKDRSQGPVTALLLAESGYAPLNPAEWIERWRPAGGAAERGGGRSGRAAGPAMLEALQGYNLLRTDRNGWIELSTDGQRCGWRWRGGEVGPEAASDGVGLAGEARREKVACKVKEERWVR